MFWAETVAFFAAACVFYRVTLLRDKGGGLHGSVRFRGNVLDLRAKLGKCRSKAAIYSHAENPFRLLSAFSPIP